MNENNLSKEEILFLASETGLYFYSDDWHNSPADNRLKAKLENFARAIEEKIVSNIL